MWTGFFLPKAAVAACSEPTERNFGEFVLAALTADAGPAFGHLNANLGRGSSPEVIATRQGPL